MIAEVTKVADDQYQIEEDARTLIKAKMIEQDSKRHDKAVTHIKKENAARASVVKK